MKLIDIAASIAVSCNKSFDAVFIEKVKLQVLSLYYKILLDLSVKGITLSDAVQVIDFTMHPDNNLFVSDKRVPNYLVYKGKHFPSVLLMPQRQPCLYTPYSRLTYGDTLATSNIPKYSLLSDRVWCTHGGILQISAVFYDIPSDICNLDELTIPPLVANDITTQLLNIEYKIAANAEAMDKQEAQLNLQ
jgi:hypothetical protein